MAKNINTFSGGGENTDLDDRLLPGNLYRRLINGQVSRSEGQDVGAIENVLGNSGLTDFVDTEAAVIGHVVDPSTETLIFFITGATSDAIYEYNELTDTTRILLKASKTGGKLNFNTSFTIQADLTGFGDERTLHFTDNLNEPRSFNIEKLFARYRGLVDGIAREWEDDVSYLIGNDVIFNSSLYTATTGTPATPNVNLAPGSNAANWRLVRSTEVDRGFTEEDISAIKRPPSSAPSVAVTQTSTNLENEDDVNDPRIDENLREKFPQFGYRWVYDDNQTSVFSPFSAPVFEVGPFSYDRSTGLMTCMESLARELEISFNTGPRDVVEVDLLYRDSSSNNTYVVESFNKLDRGWGDGAELRPRMASDPTTFSLLPISFSSNKLTRALPEREFLRTFDAVPRRAKAQAIVENRIVYGNYTEGNNIEDILREYTLDDNGNRQLVSTRRSPITVDLTASLTENTLSTATNNNNPDIIGNNGEKNLKSDRDYEIGIVYEDSVSRATPVLTSENNTLHVPLGRANRRNRASITINSKAPEFATSYSIYIKNPRDTHRNIIPLQTIPDPFDPNSFVWFRLSRADANKVVTGDHLIIKVANGSFAYGANGSYDEKTTVRVEEIGLQPRNFLEAEPPRVDPSDDTSEVITLQQPGLWMQVRNTETFIEDIVNIDDNSFTAESAARANNTRRFSNYRPIQGTVEDYIDVTHYYNAPLSPDDSSGDEGVLFAGTYNPAAGGMDQNSPAQAVIGGSGSGPMRIVVELTNPSGGTIATHFRYDYFINPTPDQGGSGNSEGRYIERRRITEDIAISTSGSIALVNGATITFGTADNWFVGDRLSVVYRRAANFLWRYLEDGFGSSNPNAGGKTNIGGRRANLVMPGNDGTYPGDPGIYGNSILQFGVEDGLNDGAGGSPLSGTEISLPFQQNVFEVGPNYFPTVEEWMFEEGLWTPGGTSGKSFSGTNLDGNPIGMSQFGFWRGQAFIPSSNISTGDQWRIRSVEIPSADDALYMIVQSGTYNHSRNRDAKDIRMKGSWNYQQGDISATTSATTANIVFETIPEELELEQEAYYETVQTFPCLNGIHFGSEMSNGQRLMQEIGMDEAGNETSEVTPITIDLDYFNCIAFNNGVESMTVRDEIATNVLPKGARVSTIQDRYGESVNDSTLIFSGPLISSRNINRLNDFSSAEVASGDVTKIMDSNEGSVQLLYPENTNLFVYQERKTNQVLVDKSTLFNADGSGNVSQSSNFLGQTYPVLGEFGIGTKPESFAVYGNSKFHVDPINKVVLQIDGEGQGAVNREVSEFGLRVEFRDSLIRRELSSEEKRNLSIPVTQQAFTADRIIGFFDDRDKKYRINIQETLPITFTSLADKPLQISTQAFPSRGEACRYPDADLIFTEVYEFFPEGGTEPPGFQVGDVVYQDIDRTSRYNGRNDWFVWFDDLTSETGTLAADASVDSTTNITTLMLTVSSSLAGAVMTGQTLTLTSTVVGTRIYTTVVEGVSGTTLTLRLVSPSALNAEDNDMGDTFRVTGRVKYVVNIDNFGNVRRRLDCNGIQPYNHDAFRASLRSFDSPQEACANGLVGQILYHNGNDATPDVEDYIYDSPYANDEYTELLQEWSTMFEYRVGSRVAHNNQAWESIVQNFQSEPSATNTNWRLLSDVPVNYMQGRTQKRGWYEIFDGPDRESFVIRILEGTVVQKVRCAIIDANRRTILLGNRFQRGSTEPLNSFISRLCRNVPFETYYFEGEGALPAVGDIMFTDNYTNMVTLPNGEISITDSVGLPLDEGSYPVEGGYYIDVNADGVVSNIDLCSQRVCLSNLVNTYAGVDGILNRQLSTTDSFTFNGIIDEEIAGTTDRQDAAQVVIRWSAKGSSRYPTSPDAFYEANIGNLAPGTTFSLALNTTEFTGTTAVNETELEYNILDFCYTRPLTSTSVGVRFYNDDVPDIADYPSSDAATSIAQIFDPTGNLGTGGIEVQDAIYFDTNAVAERYFTNQDLLDANALDGTNGTGSPLWWAFGDTDNAAAEEALLIDANGFVIDRRTAEFPFILELWYHASSVETPCQMAAGQSAMYLSDFGDPVRVNQDFEQATMILNLDGSVPPTGYYVHLDQDGTATTTDDQGIVRFWNGTSFSTIFESNTASFDNCPIALNSIVIRYSTSEQAAVCGQAPQRTVFHTGGATIGTDTTALYTNQFGPAGDGGGNLLPSGFIQSPEGTFWTWNSVARTFSPNTTACESTLCQDSGGGATNIGQPLPCTYPSYCGDPAATNTETNPGPNWIRNDNLCTFPAQRTVSVQNINNITGGVNGTAYDIVNTTVSPTSGPDGTTYAVTDGSVTIRSGWRTTTDFAVNTVDSGNGIISGNETVTTTFTGAVEEIPQAPVGCNDSTAINFLSGSDGSATCFFDLGSFTRGSDDTQACDGANGSGEGTTVSLARDDDGLRHEYTGTGTSISTTLATGTYSGDGESWVRYNNGASAATGSCPAQVRIGRFVAVVAPPEITIAIPFPLGVSVSGITGTDTVTITYRALTDLTESVTVQVTGGAASFQFTPEITDPELVGQTVVFTVVVSSGAVFSTGNSGDIEINDAF